MLPRRDFVFLSSGAALDNLIAPGMPEADAPDGESPFSNSGLVTGQPKPLKHKSIPGFMSADQIAPTIRRTTREP